MEILALLLLGIVVAVIVGSICGIVAVRHTQNLRIDLELLQSKVRRLEAHILDGTAAETVKREAPIRTPAPPAPLSVVAAQTPPEIPKPAVSQEQQDSIPPLPVHIPSVQEQRPQTAPSALSLEMQLGTRWIIWIGAVIFLGGVALALKYTYDNNLIGPSGRIMIGALTGIIALFVGEYYERRKLVIPFQAFTGGGLAIFYLCIFFAFQVYHLTGSGIAMLLAVLVTLLAISLSVIHNAMPIALLAVTGGYLSPVFLSTGQNAPWQLFTYIAILNLVALGAGYFRRWRALDLFCFGGTALLYLAWFDKFYSFPEQAAPALTFTTLFYIMFLIAPVLYSLARGIPEGLQSLTLIIGNSLFWLFCYYQVLFENYREALGLVALLQALLVFFIYLLWMRRVKDPTPTAHSLLVISLSLLTLVFPLWFRFYAIPLSWAVEGVVLLWLGFRFRSELTRLGGVAILALAGIGLLYYLPLHTEAFVPVFNASFGAWIFVVLCVTCAAQIVYVRRDEDEITLVPLAGGLSLAAIVMACFLLTAETFQYWELRGGDGWFVNASASLTLLWIIIPALMVQQAMTRQQTPLAWLAQAGYGFSLLVFIFSIGGMESESPWLLFNLFATPKLLLIICMWIGISVLAESMPFDARLGKLWLGLAGHGALALLAFLELIRWGRETTVMDTDMAVGIVSAAWALHACILIWYGLVTREHLRRYTGFALFAMAAGKTVFIDVFELDPVYRIISWLGVGMLLVVAALLYQRYSAILLSEEEERN
jgi:uncharacterized membrane protein